MASSRVAVSRALVLGRSAVASKGYGFVTLLAGRGGRPETSSGAAATAIGVREMAITARGLDSLVFPICPAFRFAEGSRGVAANLRLTIATTIVRQKGRRLRLETVVASSVVSSDLIGHAVEKGTATKSGCKIGALEVLLRQVRSRTIMRKSRETVGRHKGQPGTTESRETSRGGVAVLRSVTAAGSQKAGRDAAAMLAAAIS